MTKMTKQEKLNKNSRSLIFTYVWLGFSVLGTLALLVKQLMPATRGSMTEFLGTLWIPVLSLCMALCMMVNKLLDRKILLELIALDGYAAAQAEKHKPADEEADDEEEAQEADAPVAAETAAQPQETAGGEEQ